MVCQGNEKMIANFCASLGLSECAWVKVQHHALTRFVWANRYAVARRRLAQLVTCRPLVGVAYETPLGERKVCNLKPPTCQARLP